MLRRAGWAQVAAIVVVAMVVAAAPAGCTPGPVTARAGHDAGSVVTTGSGDESRGTAAQSGAGGGMGGGTSGTGTPARGGAGGRATPPTVDAAASERPTSSPPNRDAGADSRPDASADAALIRAPRPGEVVIDEVLVNPSGDDLGREWIELESRAGEAVDLSMAHLATTSTDVAAPAGTLGPGALLVLGASLDPTKNGGAPVAIAYNSKLILANADGQLSLCLGPCATGTVLDTVTWGTLGDAYTGHALVIDPATHALCPAETPFGAGGSFGTPGAPNPPCPGGTDDGGRQLDGSQRDSSDAD